MKTVVISIILFVCSAIHCSSQVYIGKSKQEIREMMKEERKEFIEDTSSKNTVYNLLKYVDRMDTQTLLFLFDENDICYLSKLMCDYSLLNKITKQLNEAYTRESDSLWHIKEKDKVISITMKKEDWFFTVQTKEIKE